MQTKLCQIEILKGENEAQKGALKFLEDKFVKANTEKEYYLIEVLNQKEKQVIIMDEVNSIQKNAEETKLLLLKKEKELAEQKEAFEKEKLTWQNGGNKP